MDRLRTGELVAAVSGAALFIIMFLPWFGFDLGGADEVAESFGVSIDVPDANFNAWESFDFIDLVLLVTVIAAVGLGVMAATGTAANLPVAAGAVAAGLGALSTVLVLYRILDPVGDASRKYGLFLGLIAAAGVAVGGWMAMQEEGAGWEDQPAPPPPPTSPPPPPGAPPGA